jgi:endoglucanase
MNRSFYTMFFFLVCNATSVNAQIDVNATSETRALYANLGRLAKDHTLFGHQHATEYGHGWAGDEDRSDVKSVVGSHPAVIGVDLSGFSGRSRDQIEQTKSDLKKTVVDTYNRGGVTTIAWHFPNPVSKGGFYWVDSLSLPAVKYIIPGGQAHDAYKTILRDIGEWAKSLKGSDGTLAPVIFRPYHEFDGDWFWWGAGHCTPEEFVTLWRFTVSYLRDSLQVHNFLYAFSPDNKFNTREEFLSRYPGDNWVDMVGMDNYGDMGRDGSYAMDKAIRKLRIVSDYAKEKGKLAAFTETGLESIPNPTWWTETLLKVMRTDNMQLCYVLVWRNDTKSPTHYYAPYPGHSSVPDFVKFYQDSYTLFENDLKEIYRLDNRTGQIQLNQLGFYPDATKIAVVQSENAKDFFITRNGETKSVFSGKLSPPRASDFSPRKTQIADFSTLKLPGEYVVNVPGMASSYPFTIREKIFDEVAKGSLKAFYFQRFSMVLEEKFAGKWRRPFSHPDDKVLIHASAVSAGRPEGKIISSPGGWIDAGDYNKYIVNSGITMGTLLSAYEDFPAYYKKLDVNIPESGNEVPDILDEVLWNLRWMMTMQDPADGGVYHKCTNANFDKMVMPHEATAPRYVVQKSTAAALDFAAVAAQASRVFRSFGKQFPGLSDSLLKASMNAWKWAQANPGILYDQDAMNKRFDPDIATGGYGDGNLQDEFIWAAAELVTTTGDGSYLKSVRAPVAMNVPSWNQVGMLGYYSLLRFQKTIAPEVAPDLPAIRKELLAFADALIKGADEQPYVTVMGRSAKDFIWGSSSVAANQSIVLINAFNLTGDRKYLKYATHNMDYLLGRNATGYSFVTGFGSKTPMHIHHRPSEADGVMEPVPGLVAGGPNSGMQDKCSYPSSIPDEAYTDDVCSYASNEVAINWNAPFVYLAGALEATRRKK